MKVEKRILMPIDFSTVAQNAVRHANSILEEQAAEVVLVYVNTPEKKMPEQDIHATFKTFEHNTLKEASFYYRFEVLHGNLLSELAHATEKHKADLVIMGLKDRISDVALASELMRVSKKANTYLSA